MYGRIIITKSAIQTKQIASRLAKKIAHMSSDYARVVALTGNLGAGKTIFVQGFAAALGIKEKIQSPTFVLMKIYALTQQKNAKIIAKRCHSRPPLSRRINSSENPDFLLKQKRVWIPQSLGMTAGDRIEFRKGLIKHLIHIDAYRIETPAEIEHLGFRNFLKDKDAIILIEWADRIKKLLPKDAIWITFEHGENARERSIAIKNINEGY